MDSEGLLRLANSSGYLFQLRVEQEVKRVQQYVGGNWIVIAGEHKWIDPVTEAESFIDLILQSHAGRMVAECKRVKDGTWLFLIPDGRMEMRRARLLWTYQRPDKPTISEWSDVTLTPPSPESAFCVVRGTGEGQASMLERIGGPLLRATESIAGEELLVGPPEMYGPARIYLSAIVTNAELQVCQFAPGDVAIETGELDSAKFETVPFVRFRKAMSSTRKAEDDLRSISQQNEADQRTVLVINSTALDQVLPEMEFHKPANTDKFPWEEN